MIRNIDQFQLFMDFSNCDCGRGQPSDIDLFYMGKDDFLVIGEIKNEQGHLGAMQRDFLERIVNNYSKGAIAIYVTHMDYVQDGATSVDVSMCFVREYYYKGKWYKPSEPLTVKDVIRKYT